MQAFEPSRLTQLAVVLPREGRLLGLDVGTKTIGVAVSDVFRRVASPLETIQRGKFQADAASLLAIAARNEAAAIIIGLPFNMDGSEGPRAQSTRAFVRNVQKLSALPMAFWDERLSTAAAERAMLDADLSRKRRAGLVDKLAAAYILQGALDRLNFQADVRS